MKNKYSVDIIIPIYNEEEELEASISKLYHFNKLYLKEYDWQITIADNASRDRSLEIARKLARKYKNVAYTHFEQKGRGRAVKTSWQRSKKDILVYMDVDLSTDLKSLPVLIRSLTTGYDIAIGSRLKSESKVIGRPLKREILSRTYNILIKILFNVKFSDAQCGFKAVTKKVVEELIPKIIDNAWFFDSELLILAEKSGFKIYEVPVYWVDNPGSTVRVIRTVYGDLAGLWRLFWSKPWLMNN